MAHAHNQGPSGTDMIKGMVAGIAGGLVGTWAMNQVQRMWTLAAGDRPAESAAGPHDARDWQERQEGQNSNEIAAEIIGEAALDRPLTRQERAIGATATHFAFGACMGALYGCYVETTKRSSWTHGAAFGTSVWAGADEVAMPALGLSGPTTERPTELHMQSLAAHIAYGVTAEAVRRGVRAALR